MNFIAHVTVALSLALSTAKDRPAETDVAFGAALPDLVSMAGLRVDPSTLPEMVRQGVALHHRTDAAFHSLEVFTAGVRQLREQLRTAGLALGPSRAVSHAGWELLLDGCLLDRSGVEEGFARVLEGAPDVAEWVAPANPDRWRRLLAGMRSDKWYVGYRRPETIAARLHGRLSRTSRLSFGTDEIPLVAEALALAKAGVDVEADGVLLAVVAAIGGSTDSL